MARRLGIFAHNRMDHLLRRRKLTLGAIKIKEVAYLLESSARGGGYRTSCASTEYFEQSVQWTGAQVLLHRGFLGETQHPNLNYHQHRACLDFQRGRWR